MKLILEERDIREVQGLARDLFNVTLTPADVQRIFEADHTYAGLCYAWGIDDTEQRSDLRRVLKKLGKL